MNNQVEKDKVLMYLKDKYVLTTLNNDSFTLIDNSIIYKFNGSSVSFSIEDFMKLFKDSNFYFIEEETFTVDDLKDKEYYERYKK